MATKFILFVYFSGFWAYILLLQFYGIYVFENVQYRGLIFRGYLVFVRFRGIYFMRFLEKQERYK